MIKLIYFGSDNCKLLPHPPIFQVLVIRIYLCTCGSKHTTAKSSKFSPIQSRAPYSPWKLADRELERRNWDYMCIGPCQALHHSCGLWRGECFGVENPHKSKNSSKIPRHHPPIIWLPGSLVELDKKPFSCPAKVLEISTISPFCTGMKLKSFDVFHKKTPPKPDYNHWALQSLRMWVMQVQIHALNQS